MFVRSTYFVLTPVRKFKYRINYDICVYSVVKKSKVHSVNPTNSNKR